MSLRDTRWNTDPPSDPNDRPLRAGESRCAACGVRVFDEDLYDFGDCLVCGECFDLMDGIIAEIYSLDDEQAPLFFERLKQEFAKELGLRKRNKEPVYTCTCCSKNIYEGDKYFEVLGEQICPKCILNYIAEAKKENDNSGDR